MPRGHCSLSRHREQSDGPCFEVRLAFLGSLQCPPSNPPLTLWCLRHSDTFAFIWMYMIYIYMYIYIYVYILVCICIYTYAYMYVYIFICVYIYIHIYTHICIHMYVHVYLRNIHVRKNKILEFQVIESRHARA